MATSVMVLMGGWSSEREVSLVSGKNIAEALTEGGYDVRTHDLQRDITADTLTGTGDENDFSFQ